jgi:hypothetical protein
VSEIKKQPVPVFPLWRFFNYDHGSFVGMATVNVDPFPGALLTVMFAPRRSLYFFAT